VKQQIFLFFVLGLVLQVFSGDESPALTRNGKGDLGSGGEILNVRIMSQDHISLVVSRPYDRGDAHDPGHYQIFSQGDRNFKIPRHPVEVGLEWRGIGLDRTTPWPYEGIIRYLIHLKLPTPLKLGATYHVRVNLPATTGKAIRGTASFLYEASAVNPNIKVNQVGYLPQAAYKFGYVGGYLGDLGPLLLNLKKFFVLERGTGKVMFSGTPMPRAQNDEISGEDVWELDFSSLKQPGEYVLYVPGVGISPSFRIAPDVYDRVFYHTARAFYHQRCGTPLVKPFTYFVRSLGHGVRQDAQFHESLRRSPLYSGEPIGEFRDATGGWHDAGDYGKYVPTAAVALHTILSTYELFPDKFFDGQLNIPESGNGVPDILDEAMWELDWLVKMQDPSTGYVYHKVVTQRWADNVLPEFDTAQRWIVGKTTHDTGKFAAVMAMAARVYAKFLPAKAKHYLHLAEFAWDALEKTEEKRIEESVAYTGWGQSLINTEFPVAEVYWVRPKETSSPSLARTGGFRVVQVHHTPWGKRQGGYGPMRSPQKPASAAVRVEGLKKGQPYEIAYRAAIPKPDPGFKNPPGGFGGEYGDRLGDIDERAWAAAELYKTTGNSKYHDYYLKFGVLNFGWVNFEHVQRLAAWAYVTTNYPTKADLHRQARKMFIAGGKGLIDRAKAFAYRQSVRPGGQSTRAHPPLGWGMAGTGNEYPLGLMRAYYLTGDRIFLDWALTNWDAQLGNNALSRSYITGLGFNRVKRPLHKPSLALGVDGPIPGLHILGPSATIAFARSINHNSYPENKFYPDTRKFIDEPLPNISEPSIDRMAAVAMSLAPFLTRRNIEQSP